MYFRKFMRERKGEKNFDPKAKARELGYGMVVPDLGLMLNDLNKYGYYREVNIDTAVLDDVLQAIAWMLAPFMTYVGTIGYWEAIGYLNLSSGAGFDWNQRGCASKFDALQNFPEEVRQKVDAFWRKIVVEFAFVSPKEEIRPIEKLDAGAIRSFGATSIVMQIVGTMLFQKFQDNFNLACKRWRLPFWIGCSKFGGNWDRLARFLMWSKAGYDGLNTLIHTSDVSQCDSSIPAVLQVAIYRMMNSFIKADALAFDNYVHNAVYSPMVAPEGVIVLKTHGNLSGDKNTLHLNCLAMYAVLLYSFFQTDPIYKSTRDWHWAWERFSTYIRCMILGDDIVRSMDPESPFVLTDDQVDDGFRDFGIINNAEPPDTIERVSFTSTHFCYNDTYRMYAPLPSVNKMLASLMLSNRKGGYARWSFVRACAMRNESWADVKLSELIKEYLGYLMLEQIAKLKREDDLDKIGLAWKAIRHQYMSDFELDRLYYSLE